MISTADVSILVKVKADLSRIPPDKFPVVKGADDHFYYLIFYEIEMTHYSAYTKYELVHNDVNYGPVDAEYV